jgi:hypothetical protein
MRRMIPILATITVGLTLMTGCGDKMQHVSGDAAPAGGIVPTTSPAAGRPATLPSTAASSAAVTPSHVATTRPATTKLVLGPYGLGALKLGLTFQEAMRSGLLTGGSSTRTPAGCNSDWTPKSAHGADAPVFFDGDKGIVSFTAYPGLSTPEGIKLGSSLKAVIKAYPDWSSFTGPGLEGRGWAKVPGSEGTVYNITVGNGKVVHINLQLDDQECYE